jgi:hypothetical protein
MPPQRVTVTDAAVRDPRRAYRLYPLSVQCAALAASCCALGVMPTLAAVVVSRLAD